MSEDSKRRHVRTRLALGAIALAAAALVLVSTSRYGAGLSPDSVSYIAAARHAAEGKGFIQYDGAPFVDWPPLYPSLLAVADMFGADPLSAARPLNAVAHALLVFGCGLWVLRRTRSCRLALMSSTCLLFSFPLLAISRMVWTEPLFNLLVLLFLIGFERFFASRSLVWLLSAAGIAALACLTRYVGVTLVLIGVVFLLLDREVRLRGRIFSGIVFAVLALLPLSLWFVRNFAVSSSWAGAREPSAVSLHMNIAAVVAHVSYWMVPYEFQRIPRVITGSALLLILGSCALWVIFGRGGRAYGSRVPEARRQLLFIFAYTVVLIVAASSVAFDKLAGRLLSPIYVPLFILILESIWRLSRSAGARGRPGRVLALTVLGVWLVMAGLEQVKHIPRWVEYGAGGLATKRWHQSALLSYLRIHRPTGSIFSNCPQAVYILNGEYAVYSPTRYPGLFPGGVGGVVEPHTMEARSDDRVLVWFKISTPDFLLSAPELERRFELETVREFDDGALYRFLPGGGADERM